MCLGTFYMSTFFPSSSAKAKSMAGFQIYVVNHQEDIRCYVLQTQEKVGELQFGKDSFTDMCTNLILYLHETEGKSKSITINIFQLSFGNGGMCQFKDNLKLSLEVASFI